MLSPFTNPSGQNELHLSNQPQRPENGSKSKKQLGLSRPSSRCLYLLASTRPQKLLTTRRPPRLGLVLDNEPLDGAPGILKMPLVQRKVCISSRGGSEQTHDDAQILFGVQELDLGEWDVCKCE